MPDAISAPVARPYPAHSSLNLITYSRESSFACSENLAPATMAPAKSASAGSLESSHVGFDRSGSSDSFMRANEHPVNSTVESARTRTELRCMPPEQVEPLPTPGPITPCSRGFPVRAISCLVARKYERNSETALSIGGPCPTRSRLRFGSLRFSRRPRDRP